MLKYSAANWAPDLIRLSDAKATDSSSAVAAAACTAGQTMYYDTPTQSLKCQAVGSLDAGSITTGILPIARGGTGAATLDGAGIVDKTTAQTITATKTFSSLIAGALQITGGSPGAGKVLTSDASGNATWGAAASSTQWITGGSNIYYSAGNVGIGTTTPAISLDLSNRTDAIALPKGTTAQAPPSPFAGSIRFNSTTSLVEYYNGVFWASVGNSVSPAGMMASFPMASCPSGWIEANGAAVSRTTYASLFSAIGVLYGTGDGSTTFNLPDMRGLFVRALNASGSGYDASRSLGSVQAPTTIGESVGYSHDIYYSNSDTNASSSQAYYEIPNNNTMSKPLIAMRPANIA